MAFILRSPLTSLLVVLLALIQYPLWLGKGGVVKVWDLDRQLTLQRNANSKLVARNGGLEGEVRDLKQGSLAVEEQARYKLGMVRSDEIFIQLNEADVKDRGKTPIAASLALQ
jgi:cell division protein FtsB